MGIIAIKCPSCGADVSLDESREFGFCTYCGTKVMQEKIVVEHNGSVKVDTSDELKNLYAAARNSSEAGDNATALDYYRRISAIDPNSWEALFYSVLLGLNGITNGEIGSAGMRISNCLPKVFELVSKYVTDILEQKEAVKKIADECYGYVLWLLGASHSFRQELSVGNGTTALLGAQGVVGGLINGFGGLTLNGIGSLAKSAVNSVNRSNEDAARCLKVVSVMDNCGNLIEKTFDIDDNDYKLIMINCWKVYLNLAIEHAGINDSIQNEISIKINKYDPSFKIIEKKAMTKLIDEANETIGKDASLTEVYKGGIKFLWNKIPSKVKKIALGIFIAYIIVLALALALS